MKNKLLKNKMFLIGVGIGLVFGMVLCAASVTALGLMSNKSIETPAVLPIAQVIQPTYTYRPTNTFYPTQIPPTETLVTIEPEITNMPEPTVNLKFTSNKTEGTWLVGNEVAVGQWRAIGGDCYSVIMDKTGEQLDLASGVNSIISVPTSAFSVKFVSFPGTCIWSYLGK
jgi:hypothetical protein